MSSSPAASTASVPGLSPARDSPPFFVPSSQQTFSVLCWQKEPRIFSLVQANQRSDLSYQLGWSVGAGRRAGGEVSSAVILLPFPSQ